MYGIFIYITGSFLGQMLVIHGYSTHGADGILYDILFHMLELGEVKTGFGALNVLLQDWPWIPAGFMKTRMPRHRRRFSGLLRLYLCELQNRTDCRGSLPWLVTEALFLGHGFEDG